MVPLQAEPSTVSLPPRERLAAKRRAKAIRKGQSVSHLGANHAKRTAKVPTQTLAGTRERRQAAINVAYLDRRDGYHIKRVVRRPATLTHVPPVPYLTGQEGLPCSDEESNNDSDSDMPDDATVATVLDSNLPPGSHGANVDMDADMDTHTSPAQPEDIDYDAEGETDDEAMEDHTFNTTWEPQPCSLPQMWPDAPAQDDNLNLIGNASEEDMRALFDGLDSFPADFPNNIPTTFSSTFHSTDAGTGAQGLSANMQVPGYFAMHQLYAAVDDVQAAKRSTPSPAPINSLAATWSSPLMVPSQTLTPGPTVRPPASVSTPLAHSSLLPRRVVQLASPVNTSVGTIDLFHNLTPVRRAARAPCSSTRDLVAQARLEARSPSLAIPRPVSIPVPGIFHPAPPLLHVPPLRKSLQLPDFMRNEDGNSSSDEGQSRPPTPITLGDTDIGLNEFSPPPVTQTQAPVFHYSNVQVLPHHASTQIPTVLELQLNASRVYKLSCRRKRTRYATATQTSRTRNVLSSGELTDDQRAVVSYMEFYILREMIWKHPWPQPDERDAYLSDAQLYATRETGVDGDEVFSTKFSNTIFYRMSGNKGNPLGRIESMMEETFGITGSNKGMIYQLMDKDLFLYPNADRDPGSYFCVGALGSALEIILFRASKPIGLAFMEDLCKSDNLDKCAHWHRKLRDRTARKGVPPGLLAYAATQMYWALQKLYMGSKLSFDEQHYRGVWNRYHRALLKLPHLGRLRVDMLNRVKAYYVAHWPGEEPDSDDESFPAW